MRFKHEYIIQPDVYTFLTESDRNLYKESMEKRGAADVGIMIKECFGFKPTDNPHHWKMDIHAFTDEDWLKLKEELYDLFQETSAKDYLVKNAARIFRKLEEIGREKSEEINKKRNQI